VQINSGKRDGDGDGGGGGDEKMLSYTGERGFARIQGKISAQVYLDLEDWRTVLIFLYSTS
jgi:hypothetical protein